MLQQRLTYHARVCIHVSRRTRCCTWNGHDDVIPIFLETLATSMLDYAGCHRQHIMYVSTMSSAAE